MSLVTQQVLLTLEEEGPNTATAIAHLLERRPKQVQDVLRALAQRGEVVKHGKTRNALWALPGVHVDERDAVRLVRDVAWRLGGFTVDELLEALPRKLSKGTVQLALKYWEGRAMLRRSRVGHRVHYAVVRPGGPNPARPRREPPERSVVQRRGHARPVAGTGRPTRPGNREVADLFEEITAAGGELERRSRHWVVLFGGQVIGTVPGTPSDKRALLNCRANLRRQGLPLGEPPVEGLYSSAPTRTDPRRSP